MVLGCWQVALAVVVRCCCCSVVVVVVVVVVAEHLGCAPASAGPLTEQFNQHKICKIQRNSKINY